MFFSHDSHTLSPATLSLFISYATRSTSAVWMLGYVPVSTSVLQAKAQHFFCSFWFWVILVLYFLSLSFSNHHGLFFFAAE